MDQAVRQQLRRELRRRRQQLSAAFQQQASTALSQQLQQCAEIQQASRIALYLANDGEVDPAPFAQWCIAQGKQLALPVLHPFCPGHLLFLDYHPQHPLTVNQFGIYEPELAVNAIVLLADIDVLLIPLVGFDEQGQRLGMGGGYYDRTLANVAANSHPTRIGLAHDCQRVAQLPVASWDMPMHYVVTPTAYNAITEQQAGV